jgi:tetratricopeptide (TPR) repeat protein
MRLFLGYLVFMFIMFSCSEPRVSSKAVEKDDEIVYKEQTENLDKKIKVLVAKAKVNGPKAIDYLSTDLFLKASNAQMEGDHELSKVLFKYLIELNPSDDFLKTKYSVSLISTGDLKESQKYLKEIYRNSKGKNTRVGLVLAGVYSTLGNVKSARKTYRKVLTFDKKNEDACIFLSKSYFVDSKFSMAKKTLLNCQKTNKKNPIYSYYIGKLYIDRGNLPKAHYYFKQALKIKGDFSKAILAVGLINEEKGKNTTAINIYKRHIKNNPQDTLVLNRLVQVLFIEEKFEDIIPYAERLTDLRPDDLNLKVKLGILYTDSKELDKAVSVFKDLLEVAPDSDKLNYYLGAIYQEKDEYEASIEYFSHIDDSSALYHDSSIQIANMLSGIALRNKTEKSFKEVYVRFDQFTSTKKVKDKTLLLEMSIVRSSYFDKIGQYTQAIQELEEVAEMANFSDKHRYFLASIYERKRDFNNSDKLLLSIIEKKPKDANALNFLGYSYIERGVKMDLAYKLINKAIKIKPRDGYIRDSLGWYFFKKGNMKKALRETKKARSFVQDDPTINKHMAMIHYRLKNLSKAKKYIIQAIKYSKNDGEKAEMKSIIDQIESERLPASK